jgi:hypothetical protein
VAIYHADKHAAVQPEDRDPVVREAMWGFPGNH